VTVACATSRPAPAARATWRPRRSSPSVLASALAIGMPSSPGSSPTRASAPSLTAEILPSRVTTTNAAPGPGKALRGAASMMPMPQRLQTRSKPKGTPCASGSAAVAAQRVQNRVRSTRGGSVARTAAVCAIAVTTVMKSPRRGSVRREPINAADCARQPPVESCRKLVGTAFSQVCALALPAPRDVLLVRCAE
jgi:hypothetical protein